MRRHRRATGGSAAEACGERRAGGCRAQRVSSLNVLREMPDTAQRERGGRALRLERSLKPHVSAQPLRFSDSPLRETVSCVVLVKKLHLKATASFS